MVKLSQKSPKKGAEKDQKKTKKVPRLKKDQKRTNAVSSIQYSAVESVSLLCKTETWARVLDLIGYVAVSRSKMYPRLRGRILENSDSYFQLTEDSKNMMSSVAEMYKEYVHFEGKDMTKDNGPDAGQIVSNFVDFLFNKRDEYEKDKDPSRN